MQIVLDGRVGTDASVVALGTFDGVHAGHRVLLAKAKAVARRMRLPMVVQTFAQHPLTLIDPEKVPPLLTTLQERAALIEAEGADIFYAETFTAAVRDMPPEDFVGHLVRRWKPRAVVVGFNYSFGARGAGNPALLRALGQALGFQTYVVPAIRVDGAPVSSSGIRTLLLAGRPEQARLLLSRPYQLQGTAQRTGSNLWRITPAEDGKLRMPQGSYRVLLQGGEAMYPALARVLSDGDILCGLVDAAPLEATATVRFMTAWPRKQADVCL